MAELGCQLFDAAAMFVAAMPNRDPQRPYPLSVAGSGSQTLHAVEGDIDDHVHCVFEYAIQGYVDDKDIPPKARKKIALQFDVILGNEFDGYGETILGRQGSLVLGERAEGDALPRSGRQQGPARRRGEGRQGEGRRKRACRSSCPRTARPTKSRKPSA